MQKCVKDDSFEVCVESLLELSLRAQFFDEAAVRCRGFVTVSQVVVAAYQVALFVVALLVVAAVIV